MNPKIIFFDYGQTLIHEAPFNGLQGTRALMRYCVNNPHGLSSEEVQKYVENAYEEVGRLDHSKRHLFNTEIPFQAFANYISDSLGLKFSISIDEMEEIFWNNASQPSKIEGANELLVYLKENGIHTAVVSNLSYSEKTLKNRIDTFLPDNDFDFVLVSSRYVFRKPNKRIFELALEKSGVSADEALFVGDSLECDIKGAIGANIKPIWLTDSEEISEFIKIKNLSEIIELIKNGSLL